MPEEYARSLRDENHGPYTESSPPAIKNTPFAADVHYRSLAPMAQETRKPVFHLITADGATGSRCRRRHVIAHQHFRDLASKIIQSHQSR